jgi:hypothetical protein
MSIKGGCLCGKVRYEITTQLVRPDNCYGSMCRRQHGAAFASYAALNPDDFKWISGKNPVEAYEIEDGGGWQCLGRSRSVISLWAPKPNGMK